MNISKSAQSEKLNKNVNWNVKGTFFNLYINDKAEFDAMKLLCLKKTYLALSQVLV